MDTFYDIAIKMEKDEALIESLIEYDQLRLQKSEFTPPEPFRMRISEGHILYDIVGFQDTSNFAVSARVYSLLKEHNVTGWKAYRISIEGIDEEYYGLQIVGRCGKLEQPKDPGFYKGYKYAFDTWDESDLFSPYGTVLLFCTKRVKDLFKKYKISNVILTDISEVQTYSVGAE